MKKLDHHFVRGDMYRFLVGPEKLVFPGESVAISARGHIETDTVQQLRSPAVVSSYAFYVPFRLVWSGWEDFVADADTAATVPNINMASFQFNELGEVAGSFGTLFRRAVKLVYNEFFGDADFGTHAYYTDPTLDTAQNQMLPLKTVNQFLGAVALDADENLENYTVVANTIELTEFRRRLRANAIKANQKFSGEKYVDALGRYGVEVRDALISNPVLLKSSSEVVYPQEIFNTSGSSAVGSDADPLGLGGRVGRYRVAINFTSSRRFAMEHGVVFTLHAIRPFLGRNLIPLSRAILDRRLLLEEFDKNYHEIVSTLAGTATDVEPDPLLKTSMLYNVGDMRSVNGVKGVLTYASTAALANLVYPTVNTAPKVDLALSTVFESSRIRP